MLSRKINTYIEHYLSSNTDKILIIEGARQIGKSFIIRETGKRLYKNFIEVNLVEDSEGEQLFKNVRTVEEFYFALSMKAGKKLGNYSNTLVFLDEIQHYPQYLTLLKFFRQDRRFRFIASGSLLGLALNSTTSIPVGSIIIKQMYQLDFEEFLWANGFNEEAIDRLHKKFVARESLDENQHNHLMNLFRRYLLTGGMPDVVNEYLRSNNIMKIRELQEAIRMLYAADATKYEKESGRNLVIRRIYEMIPSQMENKKKRIVAQDISGQKGDRFSRYKDEFEYLISSGIALNVQAISNPKYPLTESVSKNLLKLYINDVGLFTSQLFKNNPRPILEDQTGINLGSVYETVVAQELKAQGYKLFYYDNRQKGEVDFLIDDNENLGILPIEVKSGKDYSVHSALNNLLKVPDYNAVRGIVLSNERLIQEKGKILYLPVYYTMFLSF